MHQGLTPAISSDSATQPWVLDCPLKMACFCFTALEGLIESRLRYNIYHHNVPTRTPPITWIFTPHNEDSTSTESCNAIRVPREQNSDFEAPRVGIWRHELPT
jgi:hypothetical protein